MKFRYYFRIYYSIPPWIVYSIIFGILVLVYQYDYLIYSHVPGNNPDHPLGWWEWVDQGRYLKSSQGFYEGIYSLSHHQFHVPLYPLIGSILLSITDSHSYWLPNLLLLVGYSLLFVRLISRYVGLIPAGFILLLGLFGYEIIRFQWVIPWTTTLAAFLMMAAIYLFDRFIRLRSAGELSSGRLITNAFLFGLSMGLIIPTRPGDVVILAPFALAYAYLVLIDIRRSQASKNSLYVVLSGIVGVLIPVSIWLAFNQVTYGGFFEVPYFKGAINSGFFPYELPNKIYSHFFDSYTMYGETEQDWSSRIPILTIPLVFMLSFIFVRVTLVFRLLPKLCRQVTKYSREVKIYHINNANY